MNKDEKIDRVVTPVLVSKITSKDTLKKQKADRGFKIRENHSEKILNYLANLVRALSGKLEVLKADDWPNLLRYLEKNLHIENLEVNIFGRRGEQNSPIIANVSCGDFLYKPSVSFSSNEAISKSIGSFLEHEALKVKKEDLRASIEALKDKGKDFLNPNKLAGFSKEQIEKRMDLHHGDRAPISWTLGENISTNTTSFIPSQLIFSNYDIHLENDEIDPFLRESNSYTASGMFDYDSALLRSLRKAIVNDAFLIHWLNFLTPQRVKIGSIEDVFIREIISNLKKQSLKVSILDISTEDVGIPVYASVIIKNNGVSNFVSVGLGCAGSAIKAIRYSLMKSLSSHYIFEPNIFSPGKLDKENFDETERILFWSNLDDLNKIDWFLKGEEKDIKELESSKSSIESPIEELKTIKKRLRDMGNEYEIYVYFASEKFLKGVNYVVLKTIVPALVPLYLKEKNITLGASRLMGVSEKSKFPNTIPHPILR
ncbi:MAG: YcaO-like family protein [Candidatus Pacebacteria bacterium]|jgi:thiazole/oxazole-forming peptide maturase SagD family component|nr:hypothetical protein [bacterium]MDP6527988.1 YcaO-like family protein [Candidatus Paceibacterota bacterium]MDP6659754.1 YcaO-like family protein [Candidatus Paceibacterota bacterium]